MKNFHFFIFTLLMCTSCAVSTVPMTTATHAGLPNTLKNSSVYQKKWGHGSEDCNSKTFAQLDVLKVNERTFVLRQDKCQTFEAPFIYLLVGDNRSLVIDTGAIEDESLSPVYQTINTLIAKTNATASELLVIHSHGHSDHKAGDGQFRRHGITVIDTPKAHLQTYFDLAEWPNDTASIELGSRRIILIPTPGHHDDAVTFYDSQTQLLFTGDTLYPGLIYIKNWQDYRASIIRLVDFSQQHPVKAILGGHIEMSTTAGQLYPIGSTYQPNERPLPLSVSHLRSLNDVLSDTPTERPLIFDAFIIKPMTRFQKALSTLAAWFSD